MFYKKLSVLRGENWAIKIGYHFVNYHVRSSNISHILIDLLDTSVCSHVIKMCIYF